MNSTNRAWNVVCAVAFIVTLAVPAGVLAQTTSEEQTTSKGTSTQDGKAGVFRMGNSPSLRWGNQVRIDLHARVQADVSLQEESDAASDRLGWGNRRIGVDGVLFKRVEFQIEREFSDVEPWRDVFADVRMHRALRVRAGHFKVPFSMERTTSDFDLDFIARAASVTDISPGRETGIMLHGRGPRRFFEHEVGVFRLAEPPLKPLVESGTDGAMLTAARFTLRPAPRASESRSQRAVFPRAFMAYPATSTTMACCPPRASMSTAPRRLGVEGRWTAGRLSIKGELLRQADSREGESVSNSDLSDLIVDGGYVSGAWRIVGSPRRSRRSVDVAARFERLGFHSTSQFDAPSLGSRADHIAPLRQDAWTFGGTWLVNRWVKVQVNAIRESFVDETGIRPEIPQARWRSLMRLQFSM